MSNLWDYSPAVQSINLASAEEIANSYRQIFSEVFPDINLEYHTPQGQLITALTARDLQIVDFCRFMTNAMFNGGEGRLLDNWAWHFFRNIRIPAVNANAEVTITGVPNTVVKAGFQVTDGEQIYELPSDVQISSEGTVKVTVHAIEYLDSPGAKVNTIVEIHTPVDNVQKVTNEKEGNPAINEETDSAFYTRCIKYGLHNKDGSLSSILTSLAQVPGVSKLHGYENPTHETKTIGTLQMVPHSIALIILGGSDDDIARMLFQVKSLGCATVGDTTIVYQGEGQPIQYKIYRPKLISLHVDIKIKINIHTPGDIKFLITHAIAEGVDILDIGYDLTLAQVIGWFAKYHDVCRIEEVKIGKSTSDLGINTISIQHNELLTFQSENCIITIK